MHSRIFGIIEKERYDELVKNKEKPEIYSFLDSYLPYFADYVSKFVNIDEDFAWLIECLHSTNNLEVDTQKRTIKFSNDFKREYFKAKFDFIKRTINEENFFETFAGVYENDTDKWKSRDTTLALVDNIRKECSFYVADEYASFQTLDDFIRFVKPGVEYIVFESVDYHF